MEKLYLTTNSQTPNDIVLIAVFQFLAGNQPFITREKLLFFLVEVMVSVQSVEEGRQLIWDMLIHLVRMTGPSLITPTLLEAFVQSQIDWLLALFPELLRHAGLENVDMKQAIQSSLSDADCLPSATIQEMIHQHEIHVDQFNYYSLLQNQEIYQHADLLNQLLTELSEENLLCLDKVLFDYHHFFYTRRHTLQQYLGVEECSMDEIMDVILTHAIQVDRGIMTLRELICVCLG